MSYSRFAVYAVPEEDGLADFGASWLGWDIRTGQSSQQFPIAGLDDVTMTPRKYGFHGTIKPPFRLFDGNCLDGLQSAVTALAADIAPVETAGLTVSTLGSFLALTPVGDTGPLSHLAARFVQELDAFRAPPTAAELVRRRAASLTESQEANLAEWGYPYVLDDFRFHLTLTGKLDAAEQDKWMQHAADNLPIQPIPFAIRSIALVAERQDGNFEMLHRYALTG